MVKLIPPKEHSEMFGQYREPSYDDIWDDDDLDVSGVHDPGPAFR
jgi:hypothetical protein